MIILSNILALIAAILAVLLGLSCFTKLQNKRIQFILLITFILISALYCSTKIWKDYENLPSVEISKDQNDLPFQKATISGFRKEIYNVANQRIDKAIDYYNAAERDYNEDKYHDAANYYRKSIQIIPTMSGYLNMGLAYNNISEYLSAEESFLNGLSLSCENTNKNYKAWFLNNIGLVLFNQNKFDEAFQYIMQAIELNIEIESNSIVQNFGNFGNLYYAVGRVDDALEINQMVYKWATENEDNDCKISSLNNIGLIYLEKKEYDKAIGCFNKALIINKLVQNRSFEANLFKNLGATYEEINKRKECINYLKRSLSMYNEQNNHLQKATLLLKIGTICFEENGIEIATPYFEELAEALNYVEPSLRKAELVYRFAVIYLKIYNIDKAIETLNIARSIYLYAGKNSNDVANKINDIDELIDSIQDIKVKSANK